MCVRENTKGITIKNFPTTNRNADIFKNSTAIALLGLQLVMTLPMQARAQTIPSNAPAAAPGRTVSEVDSFADRDVEVYVSNALSAGGHVFVGCSDRILDLDLKQMFCRQMLWGDGHSELMEKVLWGEPNHVVVQTYDGTNNYYIKSLSATTRPTTLLNSTFNRPAVAFYSASIGCASKGAQLSFTSDGGKTWSEPYDVFATKPEAAQIDCVSWLSDSELVVAGRETVSSIVIKDGKPEIRWTTPLDDYACDIARLDDTHLVVLGDHLSAIETSTGKIVATTPNLVQHLNSVRGGADCAYVFGIGPGLVVFPWKDGQFHRPAQLSNERFLDVLPDRNPRLAVGGDDQTLRVWAIEDGKLVAQKFWLESDGAPPPPTQAEIRELMGLVEKVDQQAALAVLQKAQAMTDMSRGDRVRWEIEQLKKLPATQPAQPPKDH